MFDTILSMPLETEKEKKDFCTKFDKEIEKKVRTYKNITEYYRFRGYQMIMHAFRKVRWEKVTTEHQAALLEAIDKVETENHGGYLLYQVDKVLYGHEKSLFGSVQNYESEKTQMYSVRKDLKCIPCGHIGAIQYAGRWNPRIKDLSAAMGYGGTIPYECTNCGNRGLDTMALEGYKVTFEKIES